LSFEKDIERRMEMNESHIQNEMKEDKKHSWSISNYNYLESSKLRHNIYLIIILIKPVIETV